MHARVVCWLHVKRLLLLPLSPSLLLPWLLLPRLHRLPWNLIKNLCAMKLHFDVRTTVCTCMCVCLCVCVLYLSVPAARAAPKGRRRTKANAAWFFFLILKYIYVMRIYIRVYIAKCWREMEMGNFPCTSLQLALLTLRLSRSHLMLQWQRQPSGPEMVTAKAILRWIFTCL